MQKWKPDSMVLLVICLLILFFQPASGYEVSSVVVDPHGALIPGTPVTATFKVGWDASSGEPFPSENVLDMTTDLTNPRWTYTSLCVGPDRVIPHTPRMIDIGPDEPCQVYDSLRVTLEGRAPTVDSTTNRTIFRINITNSSCPQGSCFSYEYTAVVIDIGATSQEITEADERLRAFVSHIEENASRGIDTSAAEAKYNEAEREIASAHARSLTGYPEILGDLSAVLTAIDEGETALDKAWAEKSVADARERVDRADNVIAWFKGNQSTSNDAQLPAIVDKREVAASYISQAEDAIYEGNYTVARVRAQKAYLKANESYNDALNRSTVESCYGFCSFPGSSIITVIWAIILLIAMFIVGIIWWRKKNAVKPE